ncbi:MAG: YkvA family protein [Acinetobacter sp.]|uniref:YkvA family protein n=1 Tax=Acinetobacter sp. TaxID=472 RepID=UPI0026E0FF17|nr:YkvA family protein [Acinetobacter sp.]MDO5543284.1 YkvA family protein [Acinetobacter sp.]
MKWMDRLKQWAKQIKRDVYAVWFAARDPETPFMAKLLALLVAAYAISPIDLIPDFIPVLGYLDDLILVPLGIMLVLRLVPAEVMLRCRLQADAISQKPSSYIAASVFIALWLLLAYTAYFYLYRSNI